MHSINKRILCVDDDKDSCEMMTVLLDMLGYEVISALDSAEALEKAASDSFDLFLLDNWLPDINGIELCKRIRSFKPFTPILFYSGAAHEADKQEAMKAGAQAYLVKPAEIEIIEQTITRLISDGDGVKRFDSRPASSLRKSDGEKAKTLDEIREAGYRCAERARTRIERSRRLAEISRELIYASALIITEVQSKFTPPNR